MPSVWTLGKSGPWAAHSTGPLDTGAATPTLVLYVMWCVRVKSKGEGRTHAVRAEAHKAGGGEWSQDVDYVSGLAALRYAVRLRVGGCQFEFSFVVVQLVSRSTPSSSSACLSVLSVCLGVVAASYQSRSGSPSEQPSWHMD